MKIYEEMNPETLKALANANLDAGRLMAMAFQGIADKADKIGNLNISPGCPEYNFPGQILCKPVEG